VKPPLWRLARIQIAADAAEGSSVSLQYSVVDSRNQVQSQASFSRLVQYPAVVQTSDFDGTLIPGVKTSVTVSITNRSTANQNLVISLNADPSKISVGQASVSMGILPAGASKNVSFDLTGNVNANFQQTPIQIVASQNGTVFGSYAP